MALFQLWIIAKPVRLESSIYVVVLCLSQGAKR